MIKQLKIATALLLAVTGNAAAQFCAVPTAPASPQPQNQPPSACQSAPKPCEKCTKSPCYVAFGNYTTDATDLNIGTAGFPLLVSRDYDSSRMVDGPSGIGWFSSMTPRLYYATYLFSAPSTYTREADINMPDGTQFRFTANADGTFAAPAGRYDTLVKNADGTFTLTLQHSWSKLQFRADGALTSMADDFGNRIDFTYDAAGRTQRIADAAGSGRYVDVTWDSSTGRISTVTDFTGRQVKYVYGVDGTLLSVADPMASHDSMTSTNYTYVAGRFVPLLSTITDRWSRLISQLAWDANDRLMSYTDGTYNDSNPPSSIGEKYRYAYFPNGVPGDSRPFTTKSNSLGTLTYYYTSTGLVNARATYDSSGQLASKTDDFGTSTYDYAAFGQLAAVTRGSVTWKYTYDVSFPFRVSTSIPYDSQTQLRSTKWQGTKFEYAALGPNGAAVLTSVKRYRNDNVTLDLVATYQYDTAGRITYYTDQNGVVSHYEYNAAGDQTKDEVLGGVSHTYQYDSLGRLTSQTDASGHTTSVTYDLADRPLTLTLPPPNNYTPAFTMTYAYDSYDSATGLVFTTFTDPNNRTSRMGYDALGHLIQSTDSLGNTTRCGYQYDLLRTVTDANGNVTTYTYDLNRQWLATTFDDGAVESRTIGAKGTVFSVTDRRGIVTSFVYDEFARLTKRTGGNAVEFYQYDGQNLMSATDRRDSSAVPYQFTYDSSFRLASEGRFSEETISYSYIASGNLIHGYTVTAPAGSHGPTQTVTYGRDSAGRIGAIDWSGTSPNGFAISYTPTGAYSTITFPNGQTRTYTYDNQDRTLSVTNTHPSAGDMAKFVYGYDQNYAGASGTMLGQLTSVSTTAAPAANQVLGETHYSYDAAYQLTRADYPTGFEAWTYDAIGNRTSRSTQSSTLPYTYYKNGTNPNNGHRLRTDGAGPGDYLYDANGNFVGKGTPGGYVWDEFNRLASADGVVYGYDYAGQRAVITTYFATTRYVHVGSKIVRARDTSTGAVTDYVYAPGIDEPLATRASNGTITYYDVDGLGSVVASNDSAGNVVGGVAFSPWGEPRSASDFFGYTGRETASGGLWYYRARYYNPFVGRFISEDPIRALGPGSPPEYTYGANNPLSFRDPMGLAKVSFQRHNPNETVVQQAIQLPRVCHGQNSCTNFLNTSVDCACFECVANEYHMEIAVVIQYDMFLSRQGAPSGDPTWQQHESVHLDDVRQSLEQYLAGWEAAAYQDLASCRRGCQTVNKTVRTVVDQAAKNSQTKQH